LLRNPPGQIYRVSADLLEGQPILAFLIWTALLKVSDLTRYFFHVERQKSEPDNSGFEYANHAEAKKAAVRYAGELLQYNPDLFQKTGSLKLKLTDSNDHQVLEIKISAIH
jgi:uncharacterized protein DUF6894